MHVVLLNPEYPSPSALDHGGTATYTYALANALVAAGLKVTILVKPGTRTDPLAPGIDVREIPHTPRLDPFRLGRLFVLPEIVWEQGFAAGTARLLSKIHATDPIDVVEIPEYNGLGRYLPDHRPYALSINFRTPRILIDRYNNTLPDRTNLCWYAWERRAAAGADGYRTGSFALRKEISVTFGIPPGKIAVVRNPIDTTLFDHIVRSEPPPGQFDLLFTGRLECRKGAEILIECINDLLAVDPSINLTIAGETTLGESTGYRGALERSVPAEDRTRLWFLGPVRHTELLVLYRRSSCFIFPSLFENSPNSLLEAMAAEIPIVASNASGNTELIQDRKNGLLFDLHNPGGLVDAVREVFSRPLEARQRAYRARRDAREKHGPDIIAAETIECYRRLVQEKK